MKLGNARYFSSDVASSSILNDRWTCVGGPRFRGGALSVSGTHKCVRAKAGAAGRRITREAPCGATKMSTILAAFKESGAFVFTIRKYVIISVDTQSASYAGNANASVNVLRNLKVATNVRRVN